MTPDAHGIAVLVLTVVALFLFTRDRIPLESSSLIILILLVGGFELIPYEKGGERILGPVDFAHGFELWIASAAGARRYGILAPRAARTLSPGARRSSKERGRPRSG